MWPDLQRFQVDLWWAVKVAADRELQVRRAWSRSVCLKMQFQHHHSEEAHALVGAFEACSGAPTAARRPS